MEKDTVLLDVEKYNELRDFKQKIEEGKTICIITGNWSYSKTFITTDDAIKSIVETNKELGKEIERLKNINNPKEVTLNDIKKMSYWEFRKWRKS